MDYLQFLFVQLFREYNEFFNTLSYKEMFEKYKQVYIVFKNSEYNIEIINECCCMINFFENRIFSKEYIDAL